MAYFDHLDITSPKLCGTKQLLLVFCEIFAKTVIFCSKQDFQFRQKFDF